MKKLTYKGKKVRTVKTGKTHCRGCIFFYNCFNCTGEVADFEEKNRLKACTEADVKYIYT